MNGIEGGRGTEVLHHRRGAHGASGSHGCFDGSLASGSSSPPLLIHLLRIVWMALHCVRLEYLMAASEDDLTFKHIIVCPSNPPTLAPCDR